MHLYGTWVLIVGLATTNAAMISLPVTVKQNPISTRVRESRLWHEHDQRRLGANNPHHVREISLPLETFMNLVYTINITVGSPPQRIEMALDTFGNYLVVPSSDFEDSWEAPPERSYNSSLSSSYIPVGNNTSIYWADYRYYGFLSEDTVRLGSIALEGYDFEEFTRVNCEIMFCFRKGFDGIVGLAPPWNKRPWGREPQLQPNLLSYVTTQIDLDEELFALHLPGPHTPAGSLTFGGYDASLLAKEISRVPVVNGREAFADLWTIPTTHLELGTAHPLHLSLPSNTTALIDSSTPYLMLPTAFANNFSAIIGAEHGPLFFDNVPCSSRAYLPDLTIGLGEDGHNFTLTAFEYTTEVEYPNQGLACLVTVVPTGGHSLPPDSILLGAPFLRAVMGVFDFGRQEIGLGQLIRE